MDCVGIIRLSRCVAAADRLEQTGHKRDQRYAGRWRADLAETRSIQKALKEHALQQAVLLITKEEAAAAAHKARCVSVLQQPF